MKKLDFLDANHYSGFPPYLVTKYVNIAVETHSVHYIKHFLVNTAVIL